MEISTYLSDYIYLLPVCSLIHKWFDKFVGIYLTVPLSVRRPRWLLCEDHVEAASGVLHSEQGGTAAAASATWGEIESIKM